MSELQDKVTALAAELEVPGVSAGVIVDGTEEQAYAGVTSLENPLPVDATTLFQFGSTGKTYTATAIVRLAEQGLVDLDAPVRTYVPELVLKDEEVAARVTVLQLLNHTAGWDGDLMDDMGNGDDALEKYVRRMATIEQVTPLGATVSYNNASLSLAGRVIEKVTGSTYERAISELVLEPLGLTSTWFFPNDIMTRRFAVGHNRHQDGTTTVARPWALPRSGNPAGVM
jgi:CubicO group peptidase (beta-lactamase class C family)